MILQLREQNRLRASLIQSDKALPIVVVGPSTYYLAVNHLQIFEKSRWPTKFSPYWPWESLIKISIHLYVYAKENCSYLCSNIHVCAWASATEYCDWLQITAGAPYCWRYWLCRVTTWSENETSIITKMKIQNEYLQFKQHTALCDMGRTQHSSNVNDERDDCGSDHPWGFREGNFRLSWIHFGLSLFNSDGSRGYPFSLTTSNTVSTCVVTEFRPLRLLVVGWKKIVLATWGYDSYLGNRRGNYAVMDPTFTAWC